MNAVTIDNATVLGKGQIVLPPTIQEALGIQDGGRVTLIRKHDRVVMMNSAVFAMKSLQFDMQGEAETAGICSEDDVDSLIMELRQ